ncbi:AN1-type zinc finger protein 4 isoform X2 [Orcinus orca]|uniref:AN1-type zinc finger protein 4 isoform X2 n=1 Tax=Orcinus orca TaxID=9733 RepID=UPI002111A7F8|nr:AN1-type zinc finger protein 4 isoform X2 [Orcinus orca]
MFKADLVRTGIQLPTTYSRGIRKVKVMDNRKDPPFFNEDNMGPFYYRLPFYDTMELFVETLTGTCFELRVSRFEAVISVKAKIRRLEGIPICQQHLIWNNMELEDDYCLNDYNISEGCTLKLVLAMRGGPINTRRVPMEDPLREMAEYMDSSRDEVWEKTSCKKQVTFLVYREGDQLNFFRVVDRGDGTLTPLSESLSGGSVYNLHTDEDEEIEPSPSGQQIIENSITMNKMKLLKAKMENMNLSKKPKKPVKVKPRPPVVPRPSSSSTAAARHRLLRVLPHIGQSCLPSSGNTYLPDSASNAISSLPALPPADISISSIASDFIKEDNNWESNTQSHSNSGFKLPPQIPPMEFENDKELADSVLHLGSSLPRQTKNFSGNLPSNNEDDTVLFPTSEECVTEESLLPEVGSFASFTEGNADEKSSGLEGTQKSASRDSLQSTHGAGRLRTSGIGLFTNLQHFQEESLRKSSPQLEPTEFFLSARGIGMNGNNTAAGKRVGECTHHLPPVKAPIQTKKKTTKHCFLCGKKTGLATSYECRCGNNFCASHRYAETHSCTYDYKSAGRRYLQEANPVVNAPKLPKI